MTSPGKGRLSPATTGWVLALMFFGLALFILVPWKRQPEPEPTPAPYVRPPNKLAAYGLPDNPDFELLPQMFALVADQAEWIENKTKFAYWHPGVQRYEYYFEATRVNGTYRFVSISEPSDEMYFMDDESLNDSPIRFFYDVNSGEYRIVGGPIYSTRLPRNRILVEPQLPIKKIDPPPPQLYLPSPNMEPKK